MNTDIKNRIVSNALSYTQYINLTKIEIENTDVNSLDDAEKTLFDYKKLNLQRSERIEKHHTIDAELKSIILNIKTPQNWIVITENWCGDSAQNLPYIAALTKVNPEINFKILLRDSNLEVMDKYLTNGTRSIPKLIAFDEEWNELFEWGPRPQAAKELMENLKNEGLPKTAKYEKLHLWYGRNRGKEIEQEFKQILQNDSLFKKNYINL